ncbi:MAG: hypothetical protein ACR2O6_11075 [Ilumatobacteraceae bacterium]
MGNVGRDRSPSGIPRRRIVGPMYGPAETELYDRVGNSHEGLLRVRRTLLIANILLGILIVLVAIFGSTTSASGMAAILLAPLLIFLLGASLAVVVTRPDRH